MARRRRRISLLAQVMMYWARKHQRDRANTDTTPGGEVDVLTDDDQISALLDDDGATFMTD